MNLTGEFIDANTALTAGLVSKVVPADDLVEEAVKTATKIAGLSQPIGTRLKESLFLSLFLFRFYS
tara:strand:+ start:1087 stop:1284 length:198 start_codon:yes stop_codon:yes gene_type:complete